MRRAGVIGIGHEHWVDADAGYAPADQQALVDYPLSLEFGGSPKPDGTP